MKLIAEAEQAGARKAPACKELGIHVRTLQRWWHQMADQRPVVTRPEPCHKLNADERKAILNVVNQPEYASLPPTQIVPRLADQGVYLASESTFYRVMAEAEESSAWSRP